MVAEPPESVIERQRTPNAVVLSSVPGKKAVRRTKAAYAIQLSAFAVRDNARLAVEFWQARGVPAYLALLGEGERAWYAVRSGEFALRRDAASLAVQLGRKEGVNVLVVPYRPPFGSLPDSPVAAPASDSFGLGAGSEAPAAARADVVATRVISGPRFTVQLAAYATIENAAKAVAEWRLRGYDPYVCELADRGGRLRYAVRSGEYASRGEGQRAVRTLQRQDGARATLVEALRDGQGALRRIDVTPLLADPTVDLPPSSESVVRP